MNDKIRSSFAYLSGPILGLASGPVLARILGPDGRGKFATIMQPITIATSVAAIGIPISITYFSARNFSLKRLRKFALVTMFATTTIVYFSLIIYAKSLSKPHNLNYPTLIAIWSFIYLSVLVEYRRGLLLGKGLLMRLDLERFLFSTSRFLCIIFAWKFSIVHVELLAFLLLISFVSTSIILWKPSPNIHESKIGLQYSEFAKYAVPAGFVSISSVLLSRIDQILMPLQTSSTEVGYYAVAVTVSEVPVIFAILAGRASLHSSSNGEPISIQFHKSRVYLILGGLFVMAVALGSELFLSQVFGNQFEPSKAIIRILLASTLLSFPNAVIIAILCGRGSEFSAAIISLMSLIPILIGFALNWGKMNGIDAAWINLQAQATLLILGLLIIGKVCRYESGTT